MFKVGQVGEYRSSRGKSLGKGTIFKIEDGLLFVRHRYEYDSPTVTIVFNDDGTGTSRIYSGTAGRVNLGDGRVIPSGVDDGTDKDSEFVVISDSEDADTALKCREAYETFQKHRQELIAVGYEVQANVQYPGEGVTIKKEITL
jgi:hypothetical protein